MRRSSWFLLAAIIFAFIFPHLSYAATTNFFGPIISPACNCLQGTTGFTVSESAPAWGCVLASLQALMNVAVSLGVVLITIYIAWAGVAYLSAPINAEGRNQAKSRLMNAVLGLIIMLGAWLLIDSIMKVIYNSSDVQFGPWNALLQPNGAANCIAPVTPPVGLPGLNASSNAAGGVVVTSSQSGTTQPGAGKCTVAPAGPCSLANLSSTCLASEATQASETCMHESGGNSYIKQTTDWLVNNGNAPYSVGLFGTNLTDAYPITVDGQKCSAAFSQPCDPSRGDIIHGTGHCTATIIPAKMQLYNDCVASAQNPNNGIQAACDLKGMEATTHVKPWGNECGF